MGVNPHRVEVPKPERYTARPLVTDDSAFVNGVAQSWVVPVAGGRLAWVRILTATSGGNLEIRYRRTNGDEYPVAVGPADTAVVAATLLEKECTLKGVKEMIVRFTPSGNGTFTYLDVAVEGP